MFRIWALMACVGSIAVAGSGLAQGTPKGGGAYFGAPDGAFNEKTLTPPPVIPAKATVSTPVGNALMPDPSLPKLWSGGFEVGLNGASGNSDLFNLRAGFNALRKTADNLFFSDFLYTYSKQNGIITQQQALLNARDEILFVGTPWSVFASTNVEYDELRAYSFRVGVYAGVGYAVIDSEPLTWRLRAGAGVVREIGGPQDRWVPEAVFGTDVTYKIDDRQSLIANVDYYPRIDRPSQFRVRARAAYQILLDPASGATLRLGMQDRYDSEPGNAKANDLTYFATVGFTF